MSVIRRCLGCSATYPADQAACPTCGSHAGEVEQEKAAPAKPKPTRRRKT